MSGPLWTIVVLSLVAGISWWATRKEKKRAREAWEHQYSKPIGKITKTWTDENGLRVEGKFNDRRE